MGKGVVLNEEGATVTRGIDLVTEQMLATEMGVSRRTLQGWRQKGIGPPFLRLAKGRLIRYRQSDIMAWLDQQKCNSTSEY